MLLIQQIKELIAVGCFAHARRGFADALKALPKDLTLARTNTKEGIEFCNKLFKLEKEFKKENLSLEERYKQRLEKSDQFLRTFCYG